MAVVVSDMGDGHMQLLSRPPSMPVTSNAAQESAVVLMTDRGRGREVEGRTLLVLLTVLEWCVMVS